MVSAKFMLLRGRVNYMKWKHFIELYIIFIFQSIIVITTKKKTKNIVKNEGTIT